jgi:hypothetical protein
VTPTDTSTSAPGGSGGAVPTRPIDTGVPSAGGGDTGGPGLLTPRAGVISLVVLVALALLLTPAVSRLTTRRQRLRLSAGADPRAAALAAWDEVLATAVDLSVPMPANETPRGTARRLAKELSDGPATAGLRLLALGEERARYAPEAGVEGDLPTAVRAVRRGLRDLTGGKRRLRARLFPPSTVQAIMAGGARRSARASTAVGHLTEELRRVLKPRWLAPRATPDA